MSKYCVLEGLGLMKMMQIRPIGKSVNEIFKWLPRQGMRIVWYNTVGVITDQPNQK